MFRELEGKDETREEPVAETCKIQEVNKMRMDSGGMTADYSEEQWRRRGEYKMQARRGRICCMGSEAELCLIM